MKRFFVIEADTDFYSLFIREVSQSFEPGEIRYSHRPDAAVECLIPSSDSFKDWADRLETRGSLEKKEVA